MWISAPGTDAPASGSSAWFGGPRFGVYDEFLHAGPVSFGGDVRAHFLYGSNSNERSFQIGPRLAIHPPVLPIKPYVQVEIGFGGFKAKGPFGAGITPPGYSKKLQYGVLGGLDDTVLPHIDWRMVEVGYDHRSADGGSFNLLNLGTGNAVRLP